MAQGGNFRDQAVFQRLDTGTPDGYGNTHPGTWSDVLTIKVDLRETAGGEGVQADAVAATSRGTIRYRQTAAAAAITGADRVYVRGEYWQIRSRPRQVGRVPHVLEIDVERGVAI